MIKTIETKHEALAELCVDPGVTLGELDARTQEHATGGVYVNFILEDETDRVGNAYGGNHDRLVKIKSEYDPTDLHRVNHNIQAR